MCGCVGYTSDSNPGVSKGILSPVIKGTSEVSISTKLNVGCTTLCIMPKFKEYTPISAAFGAADIAPFLPPKISVFALHRGFSSSHRRFPLFLRLVLSSSSVTLEFHLLKYNQRFDRRSRGLDSVTDLSRG